MNLTVNGETTTADQPATIYAFLQARGYDPAAVAVAINREFVPRAQFSSTPLNDGDSLEVVAPMQGG